MTSPLAFDDAGQGPVTLLLHPFPFDRRVWRAVKPELALHRRVLSVDLLGFGHSTSKTPPRTMDAHADALVALLDSLQIDRVAVAGLSMGGYVALALSARYPARVSHLCLIDSRASADTEEAKQGRKQSMALVASQGVTALYDGMESRLFSRDPMPQFTDFARAVASGQSPNAVLAALVAMRDRSDYHDHFVSLSIPTLCVAGSLDTLTPPDELAALADAHAHGQFVLLDGAAHLPCIERPEALVRALNAFLPSR
ncbi:MAG: alpha/beta fold hydrolase [Deltaproteobacteria bacterium]|nr:alpha/beta fold hydrolase [Deltaproteobacteria bacterium]